VVEGGCSRHAKWTPTLLPQRLWAKSAPLPAIISIDICAFLDAPLADDDLMSTIEVRHGRPWVAVRKPMLDRRGVRPESTRMHAHERILVHGDLTSRFDAVDPVGER
jgi:hypothetical protein